MEREELETLADESMETELTIESLAEKEDITAEDLRSLLGDSVKDMSDDDLMAQWKEGEETEEGKEGDGDKTAAPPTWDRPWSFVGEKGEAVDATKIPADLLKYKLKYAADGKDEIRTLDDAIRLLQRRPLVESEAAALRAANAQYINELSKAKQAEAKYAQERDTWAWVLADPTGARFLKVLEAHQAQGPAREEPAGGYTPEEIEAAGERVYETQYRPHLQELARSYSLDGKTPPPEVVQHLDRELDKEFRRVVAEERELIGADPRGYGVARLRRLIEFDMPAMLEAVGYRRAGAAAVVGAAGGIAPNAEVLKLRAELKNAQTELAKSRLKGAPSRGSGSAAGAGAAGSGILKDKKYTSWEDMKDALEGRE